jgi:hypothetical protein
MAGQAQMSSWPLAGREGELDTFARAWANRRCRAVVICGPAGVGKSRLAQECLARAVHGGWKGRQVTASAAAAAVPLGVIAPLIPAGVDLSDPVRGFAAVAAGLADSQRRRVVWVDDLQLLDAASAVLLRQLLDAQVVRLIATVRTTGPVTEAVEALTRSDAVHRIDVVAFDREQTRGALEAALGGTVAEHTVHELYTASGGNALYLRELVQGALGAGALVHDGEIWELAGGRSMSTPRLDELIGARLDAASPAGRPVLDLLALTEPLPLADAQQAASMGVLAELEQAGLVHVAMDRRRTTLRLAHPLYGDMLRERMPAARRRDLLLEQASRTDGHGARRREDALRLAAWHLAATGTADPVHLVQGAAMARHAHDYRQAVSLLRALPEPEHTLGTRLLLGDSLAQLGDAAGAEEVLAAADAHAVSEPEVIAAVQARTFNLFWVANKVRQALAVNDAARPRVTSEMGRRLTLVNEAAMRAVSGEPGWAVDVLDSLVEDRAEEAADVSLWLRGQRSRSRRWRWSAAARKPRCGASTCTRPTCASTMRCCCRLRRTCCPRRSSP